MPLFLRRGGEFDTELAANCKTIRQFDDAITRVAFGAPDTACARHCTCKSLVHKGCSPMLTRCDWRLQGGPALMHTMRARPQRWRCRTSLSRCCAYRCGSVSRNADEVGKSRQSTNPAWKHCRLQTTPSRPQKAFPTQRWQRTPTAFFQVRLRHGCYLLCHSSVNVAPAVQCTSSSCALVAHAHAAVACALAVTPVGGHLGWVNPQSPLGAPSVHDSVVEFFTAVLSTHSTAADEKPPSSEEKAVAGIMH